MHIKSSIWKDVRTYLALQYRKFFYQLPCHFPTIEYKVKDHLSMEWIFHSGDKLFIISIMKKRRNVLYRKIAKITVLILGSVILLLVLIVCSAYLFTFLQKPLFVNKSLKLTNQLAIPQLLNPTTHNGKKVYDLTLQKGTKAFLIGKKTQTWGISGNYLGPVIRMHTGDTVEMHVTNNLGTKTTMHWHGMELPALMDGVYQIIKPDTTWNPYWTVTNQAATLWYHPHLMGSTGEQVYKGLGGMIIVDDKNSDKLNLPKQYGIDDIPVIVQDRIFDQNGQFVYKHVTDWLLGPLGFHGNTILVNGTYAPYKDVPHGWIRLRLLNASNGRRYNFGFSDNRSFYQIATDGGFLETPVKETRVELAPAERAEILVDMSDATPTTLMSYSVTDTMANPSFLINLRAMLLNLYESIVRTDTDTNQKFKILALHPTSAVGDTTPIPQRLTTIHRWTEKDAVKVRKFSLNKEAMINKKKMNPAYINEIVYKDDVELWEISNPAPGFHPFHIHDTQFLILDRNGKPPAPSERGWKDTVFVNWGDTVRILVRFTNNTDPHRPYMYHCHILEHEDMGMMGQFVVVNKDTPKSDIFVQKEYIDEYKALPMN